MIIEEERENVAWVGPADPSFLVTFVRRNVNGRDLNFFEDATGRLYVEGFNWD